MLIIRPGDGQAKLLSGLHTGPFVLLINRASSRTTRFKVLAPENASAAIRFAVIQCTGDGSATAAFENRRATT
jgi:hypothetical protein